MRVSNAWILHFHAGLVVFSRLKVGITVVLSRQKVGIAAVPTTSAVAVPRLRDERERVQTRPQGVNEHHLPSAMHKSPSFNPQFHHEVAAQAKLDKPLVAETLLKHCFITAIIHYP